MDKFDYIIYHRGCLDGYTGFYLFTKTDQWVPKPFVYPDIPAASEVPPSIKGRNVIIIDVAYQPSILKKIISQAKKVLFLDHHKTHMKEVSEMKVEPPHEIVYDMERCGATLVWDYFFPDKPRPRFVELVEDNDLGKWQNPDTIPFVAAVDVNLRMVPTFENLKKWDQLLVSKQLDEMIAEGRIFNKYKEHLIQQKAGRYQLLKFPSNEIRSIYPGLPNRKFRVGVLNGGSPSVSLVGKYVVDHFPVDFCMIYRLDISHRKWIVSLRSKEEDVEAIAAAFGGGGHTLASGFTLPIDMVFNFSILFEQKKSRKID